MNFNEYQNTALTFRLKSAGPLYAVINYGAEAGELQGLIAKGMRDGVTDQEAYRQLILKELGDGLWHIAAIANDNGFSLDEVARVNIAKLTSRKARNTLSGAGDNR